MLEILALAAPTLTVAAHWFDTLRRSRRDERARALQEGQRNAQLAHVHGALGDIKTCLDQAHDRITQVVDRVAAMEGALGARRRRRP